FLDRRRRGFGTPAGERDHLVVRGRAHRVTGRERVIGWAFAASPLPEHAAQAQENEHCEREEYDGQKVHVSQTFSNDEGGTADLARGRFGTELAASSADIM